MPRLPVDEVDVLVIDRMGKDISGVGIDPNVTGRIGVNGERDAASPRVGAMMVCDLTDRRMATRLAWDWPTSSPAACSRRLTTKRLTAT